MSDPITRRRLLLTLTAAGGAALLAACGASTPTAVPPAQTIVPASKIVPSTPAPQATTPAGQTAPATAGEKKQIEQNIEPGAPSPDLVARPPSGKPQVTLRFHMRSGGEKTEQSIYVFRPTEWEEQTGHKVKLEPSPGDANYVPKLLTLVASGSGAEPQDGEAVGGGPAVGSA